MKNFRVWFIVLSLLAIFLLPGCSVYESMNEQQALIQQLEQEKSALQKQAAQVDAAATQANKQAEDLQQRENIIRQNIAQVSQQMASATGPAFDALDEVLNQMREQRRALQNQSEAAALQVSKYASLQAQMAAQISLTDEALTQGQDKINAMQASIQSQADGVGGLIRQVGDALQSYGVPGATPAANTAADLWGGLATLLVGAVGAGSTVLYRKKAKDATQQATDNQQAAQEIAESIQLAKQESVKFKDAFDGVKPLLKGYQDTQAKAIVEKAKIAIPA